MENSPSGGRNNSMANMVDKTSVSSMSNFESFGLPKLQNMSNIQGSVSL